MSDIIIEEIEYKQNYLIRIYNSEPVESPREWDNVGTMTCWHPRYDLGDKHKFKDPDALYRELYGVEAYDALDEYYEQMFEDIYKSSKEDTDKKLNDLRAEFAKKVRDKINETHIILPVILYDHSGLSVSTKREYPFDCPFDSRQVGWVYCSNEKAQTEFPFADLKEAREAAMEHLEQEIRTFNQYLNNEVYGYEVVWKQGETVEWVDFCSNFYPDEGEKSHLGLDYMIAQAQEAADADEKKRFPLLAKLEEVKANG